MLWSRHTWSFSHTFWMCENFHSCILTSYINVPHDIHRTYFDVAVFCFVHGQKYARQSVCSCLFCFLFSLFYKKIICMYDGWLTRRYCLSNWEGLGTGLGLGILLTISQNWSDNMAYFWPSDILLTIDYLTAYFWLSGILLTVYEKKVCFDVTW